MKLASFSALHVYTPPCSRVICGYHKFIIILAFIHRFLFSAFMNYTCSNDDDRKVRQNDAFLPFPISEELRILLLLIKSLLECVLGNE